MPERRLRHVGGTPIEEAPWWALATLVLLLALVIFPTLVGLLVGFGVRTAGQRPVLALAGAGVASRKRQPPNTR